MNLATHDTSAVRTAACACGALRISATGQPKIVNACSCLDCQRRTGGSFSYTAFFPDTAIRIQGGFRSWAEKRAAGRQYEAFFCSECGVTVFTRLEALPGSTGVAVGCFADPGFQRPHGFYWVSRRHHWLPLPEGVSIQQTQ